MGLQVDLPRGDVKRSNGGYRPSLQILILNGGYPSS